MRGIPPTSGKTLEEQYGIQISQVTVTALNGIVDARLKVLDTEKADQLLGYQGALLVDDTLISAPYMHKHALKQGIYVVFYPNQKQLVQKGTPVSLVFGTVRSEPITVQ